MPGELRFTAALIHRSGPDLGATDEVVLPLTAARPPERLLRPANLDGSPVFEEWVLQSLDEWNADPPVAHYKLVGHRPRDPNVPVAAEGGDVLPWHR